MTTIHTGNTATTGFVVTADNSGDLVLKTGGSGGTTAATFDGTTQQATFNAPVSQPGAFMFRNKIINGNFDIWQRGTSQTSSSYGSVDRWFCGHSVATKTASQQAFALGQTDVPNNPKYFMRHVVTQGATNAASYAAMWQSIEGVTTLSGQTSTLSFWAKADSAKNIAIELFQSFGTGGSPSAGVGSIGSQLVALTTTWTKFTITISIPSISGNTLGSNGDDWLGVFFWFDAGSNFSSRSASLGQQSGTFDIAQVQIEEGTAATPFEMRPYSVEESLCFRYYYKIGPNAVTKSLTLLGNASSSTRGWGDVVFPVPMRTEPIAMETSGTPSHYGVARVGITTYTGTTGPVYSTLTTRYMATLYLDVAGGQSLATDQGCAIRAINADAFLAWSAEL